MTLKYELTKAFHKRKIIIRCITYDCLKHTLPQTNNWIDYNPMNTGFSKFIDEENYYPYYSHGICPSCLNSIRNKKKGALEKKVGWLKEF